MAALSLFLDAPVTWACLGKPNFSFSDFWCVCVSVCVEMKSFCYILNGSHTVPDES